MNILFIRETIVFILKINYSIYKKIYTIQDELVIIDFT